jgi:hypothetical protein
MLAGRIVKVGRNPLLYFFLKRQQPDAEIRCGSSRASPLDGIAGRPSFHGPVAANQPDDAATFGITDGGDDRLKFSQPSAESKAMLVTNPPSLSQACVAGRANGFRVFVTHAVRNCFLADVFG